MWQVEMVKIVRYLIQDTSASPDNSDNDIQETIVVAAQLTQKDVVFERDYQVDVDASTISPDPTTNGVGGRPKDDAFINIVSLRAACIISKGDAKKAAGCGVMVSDGLSRIDTRDKAKLLREISLDYCSEYAKAVEEFEMGQNVPGLAIIGPYSDGTSVFPGHGMESEFRNRVLLD